MDALAEDHFQFVVGLASGQTARLNALNSGEEKGYVIDWKFLDTQGRVLAQSQESVFLPAVQMKSFDLNAADLEGAVKIIEGTARSMGIDVQG